MPLQIVPSAPDCMASKRVSSLWPPTDSQYDWGPGLCVDLSRTLVSVSLNNCRCVTVLLEDPALTWTAWEQMSSNYPFRRPHHFHLSCCHGAIRGSLCLTLPNSPAPRCSRHHVELWELPSPALGWLCPTVPVQPHQNAGQVSKTHLGLPKGPWLKGFFWPWKPTMMKSPSTVFPTTSTPKESRSSTVILAEFQAVQLKIYNPNIFIKFDNKASLNRFQEYHRLLISSGEPLLPSGFVSDGSIWQNCGQIFQNSR